MASMIKPDWWDTWVIQGLYGAKLREGAPTDVRRAFSRYQSDVQKYKV